MAYTPKYIRKKARGLWIFDLAGAVFLGLLLLGGGMFLRDRLQSKQDQDAFRALAALVAQGESPQATAPAQDAASQPGLAPTSAYAILQAQNPDFAAWLTIPGTNIDYPVMHTPNDIEHYIYRAFDGSDSPSGTPFVGDYGDLDSQRCIIYGHNMKDGTMFHDLLNYEKQSFWEKNPTFTVHTLEGERTYEIFAAVRTRVLETGEAGLRFYRLEDGVEEWLLKRALYDTGIIPEEEDDILILSTCSYHTDEGRFIIAARQMEET